METPTYFNLHQFQNEYVSNYFDFIKNLEDWNFKHYLAFLEHEYFEIYTELCNAKGEEEMYKSLEIYFEDDKFIYQIITKYGERLDELMVEKKLDFEDDNSYDDARLLFIKDNIWEVHLDLQTVIYDIYSFLYNEVAKTILTEKETKLSQFPDIESYKDKEKGNNVPYKLALLDEMKVIENLNTQFTNKSDIFKILTFLVGGNGDNVEKYYNSIYGNYSGANQITETHRKKAKEIYFK